MNVIDIDKLRLFPPDPRPPFRGGGDLPNGPRTGGKDRGTAQLILLDKTRQPRAFGEDEGRGVCVPMHAPRVLAWNSPIRTSTQKIEGHQQRINQGIETRLPAVNLLGEGEISLPPASRRRQPNLTILQVTWRTGGAIERLVWHLLHAGRSSVKPLSWGAVM